MLARAFAADPAYRWIHPGEREWQRAGPRFFAALIAHFRRHGVAVQSACGGAALLGAGPDPIPHGAQLALAARLVAGLGLRLPRGVRVGAALERLRSTEPHGYVAILGTATERRGRGLASALLRIAISHADARDIPLRLETADEQNLSFYARHGFETAAETAVSGGGPRLWALCRPPGAA